jgi:hypothetical protein
MKTSPNRRKGFGRRDIGVHAYLSAKEYMLAMGMARLAGKTVGRLMSDLLTVELAEYERKHPGVLRASAKEALAETIDNDE